MVSDAGRSRCSSACQLCAYPTRKSGSTAKVFVALGGATNPSASVSRLASVLSTLKDFDSGGCCASSISIDWYTDVLRYTPYPARITSDDPGTGRTATPMRG